MSRSLSRQGGRSTPMGPGWGQGLFVALALAAVGCGDDHTVGRRAQPDAEPLEPDAAVLDAAPEVERLHDATVVDFGPPSPPLEVPSEGAATEIAAVEGRLGLFARNLSTGDTWTHLPDEPVYVGGLMRFAPALVYAQRVDARELSPIGPVTVRPDHDRVGPALGRLSEPRVVSAEDLVRWTLIDADRTAEAALVELLGGADAVNAGLASLQIPGVGRYLDPCEHDRVVAEALDSRFADVPCAALARWLHAREGDGLVPQPFAQEPVFDEDALAEAWAEPAVLGAMTITPRALGRLLARLDDLTLLPTRPGSAIVRVLMDGAVGSGGPGDVVPASAWVANLEAGFPQGRAWAGLVRGGGGAPFVFVAAINGAPSAVGLGEHFAALASLSYDALVGAEETWPPTVGEVPAWLRAVVVVDADEAAQCDADFAGDYDGLLACRRAVERAEVPLQTRLGATVFVDTGPRVDLAWFFSTPSGHRHRFQVRLPPGNLWTWTRSLRATVAGAWRVTIYANGAPVADRPVMVR